jgi:hypothetical protein
MTKNFFYYCFRCKVTSDSPYGKICRYLKGKRPDFRERDFCETDLVLEALSAFYLPVALKYLKDKGKCSEEELKQYTRISIYRLLQRIYFLVEFCELGEELLPSSLRFALKFNNNTDNPGCQQNEQKEETPKNLELLHTEDDEFFSKIFS